MNPGHQADAVTIRSPDGQSSATFHPGKGGIGSSLMLPSQGRPREWLYVRRDFHAREEDTGGWPFLFPACGRHRLGEELGVYDWQGNRYRMPLHGFAMRRPWTVAAVEPNRIVMALEDSESTRDVYPFSFRVELTYEMADRRLNCRLRAINRGKEPMPFCAGFHPYFLVDPAQAATWTITGAIRRVGRYAAGYTEVEAWEEARGPLAVDAAARENRLVEVDPDQPVVFSEAGRDVLRIHPNQPGDTISYRYLQTWRSGNDPFICLEPWTGYPNALNHPPRAQLVQAGTTAEANLIVEAIG